MMIDINKCDLNDDYFHFSNIKNIHNILNNGLIPLSGPASNMIKDRPNVSVSQGGKGIMGIINSFIYLFSTEIKISKIPEEYRKYFVEISDFNSNNLISREIVCRAIIRKLKDEVYFRVKLDESQLELARIGGGLTGYDVNLPVAIDKSNLSIITDSNNNVLSAYDVAKYVYEKAKNIDVFREEHEDFFYMFEGIEQNINFDYNNDIIGKHR